MTGLRAGGEFRSMSSARCVFYLFSLIAQVLTQSQRPGFLLLAVLLSIPVFAQAQQQCAANVTREPSANGESWTLREPVVTARIADCAQIQVNNGDRVRVSSQGCVHTEDGWKNYVDPRGTNSDRLYHGLIWIPGTT